MKRIMLLLGVLVLGAIVAGQLRAEDNPFLGTWKLNAAKSKAEGTTVPKSMTRTVTAAGDKVTYSFTLPVPGTKQKAKVAVEK